MSVFKKLDLYSLLLILIIIFSLILLMFMVSEISISAKEARNFFENQALFYKALRYIGGIFGQNDYSLRVPIIILHIINIFLLFTLSNKFLRYRGDALLCVLLFTLLPGVNFVALFANESIVLLNISLIFALLYTSFMGSKQRDFILRMLCVGGILSLGFEYLILIFGVIAYLLRQKRFYESAFCAILMMLNLAFFDNNIDGRPRAYFFDTLSQMAMLYSPVLFIYYAYSIYWGVVVKNNILAYIAAASLLFCMILSIRQSINFYTFLPQSLVGFPIMIMCFLNDLRIKLPSFRRKNYIFLLLIFITLLLELGIIFGNKITYYASAKQNFAKSYYFSKELASSLKEIGIKAIKSHSNLRYQLKFYGIEESKTPKLIPTYGAPRSDIKIIYNQKIVKSYDIKK